MYDESLHVKHVHTRLDWSATIPTKGDCQGT